MLNVRLDAEQEKQLKKYIEQHNVSKTSVVKEALELYFAKEDLKQSPYELGNDLFGAASSHEGDLSTSYKRKLKDKLVAKHSD
ncbi:MAG: CopG family transcriptional regulator [Cyclobacteriaceae bacterium]